MNQLNPSNCEDEDLEAIRHGLEQSIAGVGRPGADFFREFEEKHKISEQFEDAEEV